MGSRRACVIGSGPNGLAAAIVLAGAGLAVEVFESEPQPGGAVRTLPLTLPGFLHDFGSSVYPFAAGSPFFSSLSLHEYGLEWLHSPAPLAHPFDDGTALVLERTIEDTCSTLGSDGPAWRDLVEPFADRWIEFAADVLRPLLSFPKHPLLMSSFARHGIMSASSLAERLFSQDRTRALIAGVAAHSFLSLHEPFSAAFGILLGAAAHAIGWPIAAGGAQSITSALCACLSAAGGVLRTSTRIDEVSSLHGYRPVLCDVTPRHLLGIAGSRLTPSYRHSLAKYRYGPGAFKLDYALRQPIPWKAQDCRRAATVHLGGSMQEIGTSEAQMRRGYAPEKPFVILVQPSLFDPSRAPHGYHTAWAYCHVPNGCRLDMLQRIEAQIERFAPGFRDCVLARHAFSPSALEEMDTNLVGGDISGGANDWRQMLFRPTWRQYATSDPDLFLCSSSTPPGGGVHGMCGFHAANLALTRLSRRAK